MAQKETKLYDSVLVVELQEGANVPFISYKYPKTFEEDSFSNSVTQFCFPDMDKFPTTAMPKEIFSFVLTEGDGERRFGYCMRKLPPGTGPLYPVAFSIMAYFPCFPLYSKILEEMAYHYENSSMSDLTAFVDSILKQQYPDPGAAFEVKIQGKLSRFTRPNDSDSLLQHIELETILTSLEEKNILSIFASMLVERRIIFCSQQLSTLSSCVQSAVALLYPFSWQHIYIPVLPRSLLSFVCAPMPFIVGVLKTDLEEVLRNPMDEVILIDIDNDEFILAPDGNPYTDFELIPSDYIEDLSKLLKSSTKVIKKMAKKKKGTLDETQRGQIKYELNMINKDLTEAFINFFVRILGEYRGFIKGDRFDTDGFLEDQPPDIRDFVEQLSMAQMFECFVQERVNGLEGGFEKKIDQAQKLEAFAMAKLGLTEGDSGSISTRGNRPTKKKKTKNTWSTLRSQFKRNEPAPPPDTEITFGSPTLVKASTNRTDGTEVKPLPSIPEFVVPSKPLPKPPATPPKPVSDLKSSITRSSSFPDAFEPPERIATPNVNTLKKPPTRGAPPTRAQPPTRSVNAPQSQAPNPSSRRNAPPRGGPSRGSTPPRSTPPTRGVPPNRGAPPTRGAPTRGVPPTRGNIAPSRGAANTSPINILPSTDTNSQRKVPPPRSPRLLSKSSENNNKIQSRNGPPPRTAPNSGSKNDGRPLPGNPGGNSSLPNRSNRYTMKIQSTTAQNYFDNLQSNPNPQSNIEKPALVKPRQRPVSLKPGVVLQPNPWNSSSPPY